MIQLTDVWFDHLFDDKPKDEWSLRGLHLTIEQGEYVALLGSNGSGKSTFARLCNGLYLPCLGHVVVDGKYRTDQPDHIWDIRRRVGLVFQNPDNQIVGTTVADDIAFGLENIGLPSGEIRRRLTIVIERMGLQGLEERPPHLLSGGQKQRLAIASILALEPQMLLFDEATTMVDAQGREDMMSIMKALQQEGKTIVHITHSFAEALQADRILLFEQGELCLDMPTAQVGNYWEELQQQGILFPPTLVFAKYLQDRGYQMAMPLGKPTELVEDLWKLHLKM